MPCRLLLLFHLAAAKSFEEVLIATTPKPGWGREIVIAGPLPLHEGVSIYESGKQLRFAAEMFAHWVNSERGGIVINGTRHAVRIVFYDGSDSEEQTHNATLHAILDLKADFILGGVSTRLTTGVSLLCKQYKKIMLSAGSHTPSVFALSNYSFAMASYLPTTASDMIHLTVRAAEIIDQHKATTPVFEAIDGDDQITVVGAAADGVTVAIDPALPESPCDGTTTSLGTCRDSLAFGFVEETTAGWPEAFCDASRAVVVDNHLKSPPYTAGTPLTHYVDASIQSEDMDATLQALQRSGTTVVVFCGYFPVFRELIAGLERLNWTPFAVLVGTAIVSDPSFEDAVIKDWWQGEYVFGVKQWHWKLPGVGEMSGLTAEEFNEKYRKRNGADATEYAAGQFQQLLMLVAAVEEADSLDTEVVAQQLLNQQVSDIYGTFSYRQQDGMSAKANIALQFSNARPHITYPFELRTNSLNFPQLGWKARRCRLLKTFRHSGYCTHEGLVCKRGDGGTWSGSLCQDWISDTPMSFYVVVIIIPLLCAGSLFFVAWFVRRCYKRKYDWKKVQEAIESIHKPQYPMVMVKFSTMKQLGKFVKHEDLRNAGQAICYDTVEELRTLSRYSPVVFISHQWLGYSTPDPNNDHFRATVEACEKLCQAQHVDPEDLLVWIDYMSIPQKLQNTQLLAIHSLAIYARCCRYFIIVAPQVLHADSQLECSPATYLKRGWCRLEQWSRLTYGRKGMYLFGETRELQVLDSDAMREWCRSSIMVFEGDFTCQADKKRLCSTVLGLWAIAVLKKQGGKEYFLYDLVNENRRRVFPPELFPRGQSHLAEKCILHKDYGAGLKREVLNVVDFAQGSDSDLSTSSPKRFMKRGLSMFKSSKNASPTRRVHLKPLKPLKSLTRKQKLDYPFDLHI
ncbi:hypothetical protein AB1Y20_000576 [Prymnesium parvum]|uniref:Leucine-binding protein domain-containing protein n=1 Tax=Prymnesium parvum TaxID=97485 RepID=A0AB34K591_PRYPA